MSDEPASTKAKLKWFFPKDGLMACETLCQKMKVNVAKKRGILKKVGSLLPRQFSER